MLPTVRNRRNPAQPRGRRRRHRRGDRPRLPGVTLLRADHALATLLPHLLVIPRAALRIDLEIFAPQSQKESAHGPRSALWARLMAAAQPWCRRTPVCRLSSLAAAQEASPAVVAGTRSVSGPGSVDWGPHASPPAAHHAADGRDPGRPTLPSPRVGVRGEGGRLAGARLQGRRWGAPDEPAGDSLTIEQPPAAASPGTQLPLI